MPDPVKVSADASDNVSVASVSFFYEFDLRESPALGRSRALVLPPTLIGTDTSVPYEVNWDVPNDCSSYLVWAEATDNCGNKATSGNVSVFNSNFCEVGGPAQARPFHWSSQLEAPGSVGRVSLNAALIAIGPGKQQGAAQAKREENRVDGELVQGGSRPGVWRFDFSEGAAPGSVRILAGDALEVNDNAVVFRLGGTTGERVSFVFRPRD